jgi:hypothetical protein
MFNLCSINELPVELLREIFLSYYDNRLGRPTKLLHICRQWYTVARETRTLWSILHFHICSEREKCPINLPTFLAKYTWEHALAIRYFSPGELREGIEQLGDTKFTLLVDLCNGSPKLSRIEHIPALQSMINSRCTSLVISNTFAKSSQCALVANLQALRSLDIVGSHTEWSSAVKSSFFTDLNAKRHPLHSLTLRILLPSSILKYPDIFRRIYHLDLHTSVEWRVEDLQQLGAVLKKVRTLSLSGFPISSWQPKVTITSKHVFHLSLFMSPFIFHNSTCHSLVALSLESDVHSSKTRLIDPDEILELPSLRYMIYKGFWGYLPKFFAPNLIILALRSYVDVSGDPRLHIEIFKLQVLYMSPRLIHLEVNGDTRPFLEVILTALSSVVDLEIVLDGWSPSTIAFTQLLSGYNPICPNLLNLKLGLQVNEVDWEAAMVSLTSTSRSVLRAREMCNQVPSLQTLKYKIVKDSSSDPDPGMGRVSELWERNLRDGSEEIWERERKRLLSRQGWTDCQPNN